MTIQCDADIIMAKASTIKRCLNAIEQVNQTKNTMETWMVEDLIVLNLQRAIQACLDLANHLIAANHWDLPKSASQSMEIIARNNVVPRDMLNSLRSMVGFRNIAVHNYTILEPEIIQSIVKNHLSDIESLVQSVLGLMGE